MSILGEGLVEIRPVISSGLFGSTLQNLLSSPLASIEKLAQQSFDNIGLAAGELATKFGVSQDAAANFAVGLSSTLPAVLGIGVAVGVAADVVKHMADAFESAALPVLQFQRISGATADESSRFVAVLGEFGIASQAAGTAILRMDNNFQVHQKTLQDLGVTTTDLNGKTLQGIPAFEALAQAFSNTTDQATRTNLIVQAFGTRIGAQLLPLLVQGKQGLQDLFAAVPSGLIFNQAQLQQAQDFKVATAELGQSFKGLEVEIGAGLVPALTRMADGLVTVVKFFDDAGKAAELFGGHVHNGTTAVASFIENAVPFLGILDKIGGSHKNAASAAQQYADAQTAAAKALSQGEKDLEANISAQNTYADSLQTVADDQNKIVDLTTQVNDLQLNSAATVDLFAKNMNALNTANEQVAASTEQVSQAYKALQDILHPSAETVGKATLAEAEAQNNLAQAKQSVVDQEQKIKDLQAVSVNSPDLVNAELQLQSARLGVTSATFSLQDAQQQLHDIQNPAGTDALTQAENNYQTSLNNRQAAVQRAADAQKTVDAEQAGRLSSLATKTDELRTAEDKLTRDRQTVGFDALKAFNAQLALSSDLTTATNTALTNEIQIVEQIYPAAKAALDKLLTLIPTTGLGLVPGGTGIPGLQGGPPLVGGQPAGTSGVATVVGGALGPGAGKAGTLPLSSTVTGGVTVNIHPSAGMSETQTGAAAAAAIAWHTQGRGPS